VANLTLSKWRGLAPFKNAYVKHFPEARQDAASITTLLHISDLHIGSAEASERLPRLQQLLRNMIEEVPKGQKVVTIISGDLLDSPQDSHYNSARAFIDVVRNLTPEPPVMVLGNHDVRNDGYLSENLRSAIRMPMDRIRWMEDRQLAFVCFNSVTGGKLAKGRIGPQQFADVGNEIDGKRNWKDYTLVGVLHHHPMPVDQPAWYAAPFYERVFDRFFDSTDALEDASDFNHFVGLRKFAAVLHGHKHIPRVAGIDRPSGVDPHRVAVFGCGSSVGKVRTKDNKVFLSLNRIDINHRAGSMTCRLMAERTLGAGMEKWESHEVLYGQRLES
jgi:3',5'-cyclic AMP phosphodiesterase CpdA